MEFIKMPMEIENKSMEIIAPYLKGLYLDEAETRVYSRIIHAAGDVDYAPLIHIHPEAIAAAQKALQAGCNIYTDVEMVRTGINKRKLAQFGGEVHCLIADPEVAALAKANGTTRAVASMQRAAAEHPGAILAVGNAPTALLTIADLIETAGLRPALVIGVPVGFVNVVESKERIIKAAAAPYIVSRGRKGGSNVAAAICNAMLYQIRR